MTLRRLAGATELRRLAPEDPYVGQLADGGISSAWAGSDGSLGWVLASRRTPGRGHLVALGSHRAAVELLLGVVGELGDEVGSVSLPHGAAHLLPSAYALDPANDWEWFVTTAPPPGQPGEASVEWLGDTDHGAITSLLRAHSGRHDAEPGQPHARRWCGIRGDGGDLLAVAAHTEFWPDVPFLASIATRTDVRGQGLGAAVTAWVTRRLLAEGSPLVTLGMYSDNATARRIYQRLGFTIAHSFTSGRLVRR